VAVKEVPHVFWREGGSNSPEEAVEAREKAKECELVLRSVSVLVRARATGAPGVGVYWKRWDVELFWG
jgi:hypothetical protein